MARSFRCLQGEHRLRQDEETSRPYCDGSIPASVTAMGAANAWQECECECHVAPRQELINRWHTDPEYRSFLGEPLAIL